MEKLHLPQFNSVSGEVLIPGSKSISNRILLLAAMAKGETLIHNLLTSDDTERMKEALITLGIKLKEVNKATESFLVEGSEAGFPVKEAELFLGNAGTAFRSLTAALAVNEGEYQLSGIPRMHERPIGDLVEALNHLGLKVEYLKNRGYPPLKISPGEIKHDEVSVKGDVSSQYLTALLMALPKLKQKLTIKIDGELISKPYIDITLTLLKEFGVEITHHNYQEFFIPEDATFTSPGEFYVESDASSASYFLALGALCGPLKVKGVGSSSIQGDIEFISALEEMGAEIEWAENYVIVSPPKEGKLKGIDLDCNHIPDAAMTLAVLAPFATTPTHLRNIASWRVKETDRLHAMATELSKLGVTVKEGEDYLVIEPTEHFNRDIEIETYDDHRIAMCFSLCAFKTPLTILDPKCVEKTFPDYFSRYHSVIEQISPLG